MQNILFDFISNYITLTNEEKEALIDLDIFRTVKKGDVLLKEGEKSNLGYFVLKGCIRKYYIKNGEEKSTAFFTEMEGTTPNCVLTGEPSEYYIATVEDSVLTVSNPNMEEEIFNKFPKFEKLCRVLSEALVAKEQLNLDEFKTSTPEERYLSVLKNRPDLIQRIPQYQLASFLGITPQSLSRLRARIVEKKS